MPGVADAYPASDHEPLQARASKAFTSPSLTAQPQSDARPARPYFQCAA